MGHAQGAFLLVTPAPSLQRMAARFVRGVGRERHPRTAIGSMTTGE
jgi:hypothetical protein